MSRRRRSARSGRRSSYQRRQKRTAQQLVASVFALAVLIFLGHEFATKAAGCFGSMGQTAQSTSTQSGAYDAKTEKDIEEASPSPSFRLKRERVKAD